MVPGWNWSTDLQRLMEERRDLEGGETQMSAPGWNWNVNLVTRMEVGWYMEGSDASISESGFRWARPAWSWDISWNLGAFEMVAAWIWDAILRTWMEVRRTSLILDELEMVPGWSWDAINGPGWRWDVTKMEVKWKYKDVDWGEVLLGWGGEVNLWACMEVRRPGPGWDGTRTELRQISRDLNKLWWD